MVPARESRAKLLHAEIIFAATTIFRNDLKNSVGIRISISTDVNDTVAEELIPDSIYMSIKWHFEGTAGEMVRLTFQKPKTSAKITIALYSVWARI